MASPIGQRLPGAGGQNIGSAVGTISIDTSGMVTAQRAVEVASRQITASMNQINSPLTNIANRFREVSKAAQDFKNTDLGVIQRGLENAAKSMTLLSGAATGLTALGVGAASSVNLINARFKVFLGSAVAAQKELNNVRKAADDTGQPFLELADTAAQLLGLTKSYNVEVTKLVTLSQQLKAVDPTARAFDVSIATREFLSGNALSLIRRFEGLDAGTLNSIAKSGNDAATKIALLSRYLEDLGFGKDLLRDLADEGVFAFSQLRSEVTEALSTAFTPFLKGFLLPAAQAFSAFVRQIRETNPALLSLGAGITVFTAGLAPALFGIAKLIDGYQKLKTLANAANLPTGAIGAVAGTGLAVAGGLAAGDFAARRLAAAGVTTGDLGRVAQGENPLDIVAERVIQGVAVTAAAFLEAIKDIVQIFAFAKDQIGQAFELVVAGIDLVGAQLAIAGANIARSIADLVQAFDPARADQIRQNAVLQSNAAGTRAFLAQERLSRGIDPSQTAATLEAINQVFTEIQRNILGGTARFLDPNADRRTDQQLLDDIAAGLAAIPAKLQDPSDKLQQQLIANADEFQKTAEKVAEINESLAEEQKQIDEDRRIQQSRAEFAVIQGRGREDVSTLRAQGIEDINIARRRNRDIALLGNELVQITAEIEGRRNDLLRQSGEDSIAAAEEHEKRLREIEERTNRDVARGAARLDANAVFDALQSGIDATNKENTGFNAETKARKKNLDQQLADLDRSLILERDKKVSALREQFALEDQERQIARQQQAEDLAFRRAVEDEDRRIAAFQQAEDFIRQDNARKAHANKEITDLNKALTDATGIRTEIVNKIIEGFNGMKWATTDFTNFLRIKGQELLAGFTNTSPANPAPRPGQQVPTPFARGGMAQGLVKINDGGGFESGFIRNQLALFTNPTQIFSAQQTQALLAGGGGPNLTIGTFAPVFGDIGKRTDEDVMGMMRQAMMEVIQQAGG